MDQHPTDITLPCPIAHECGGCSLGGMPYADQLSRKQRQVEELFFPLCTSDTAFLPILGMDEPLHYRTKIVSPVVSARKKRSFRSMARTGRAGKVALRAADIATGLYAAGTHRVVACESCPVEHPSGRRVVGAVRQIMARHGMAPYDEDSGSGFVRHVVVRVGANSGEVLVTVVTNGREFTGVKNFCRELVRAVPEVTTVVQNVNTRSTNVIFGEEEHVLYGPGFILDTLCGLSFRISSSSFYQVNGVQVEALYRCAVGMAPPGCTSVLDAYCGTGTIGIVAASALPKALVTGVDSTASAIEDARLNAAHNGIENVSFSADDAGRFMHRLASRSTPIDVAFVDPPRAGLSSEAAEALAALAPKRVVYISCNPQTQARDVAGLVDAGWRVVALQAVDMFPHTEHIENVVCLEPGGK